MPSRNRFLEKKKAALKAATNNNVISVYIKKVDCASCDFGENGSNSCGGGYNIRYPGEGGCSHGRIKR